MARFLHKDTLSIGFFVSRPLTHSRFQPTDDDTAAVPHQQGATVQIFNVQDVTSERPPPAVSAPPSPPTPLCMCDVASGCFASIKSKGFYLH